MELNRSIAKVAGAVAAVGLLAACSDSPTAVSPTMLVKAPSFDINNSTALNYATVKAVKGLVKVCNAGPQAITFNVSAVSVAPPDATIGAIVGSNPMTLAVNTCSTVWSKGAEADDVVGGDKQVNVSVNVTSGNFLGSTLPAAANALPADSPCTDGQSIGGNPTTVCINNYHGAVIEITTTSPTTPPPVCDFSTGGGFVLDNNYRISYGWNAGRADGGFAYGDLNYKNHDTGEHIHVWNVTDYGHPTTGPLSAFPLSRYASGLGEIDGEPGHFIEFRFLDAGEPGTSDRVWLAVDGVVKLVEQVVDGGNVQLHNQCKKAPKAEKH